MFFVFNYKNNFKINKKINFDICQIELEVIKTFLSSPPKQVHLEQYLK